jgi:erythromycin esterase-like protein
MCQLGNSCLAEWLRGHNRHIKKDKVGFYGLDVTASGSLLMRFLNI